MSSFIKLFIVALIASAFAPGNPLFGFRLADTPDAYEMLPIAACEDPSAGCAIAGRVVYGVRAQAAYVAGLAYDWLAVSSQGEIAPPTPRRGFGLPFSPAEHMSEEMTEPAPDHHDV